MCILYFAYLNWSDVRVCASVRARLQNSKNVKCVLRTVRKSGDCIAGLFNFSRLFSRSFSVI